jgi:hypothetical protein
MRTLPLSASVQPGDAVQQRRLADARLAQQCHEFAARQRERDGAEDGEWRS